MGGTAHQNFNMNVFYGGRFEKRTQVQASFVDIGGEKFLNYSLTHREGRNPAEERTGQDVTNNYRINSKGEFVSGDGLTVPEANKQKALIEVAQKILSSKEFTQGEAQNGVPQDTITQFQQGVEAANKSTTDYRLRFRGGPSLGSPH